MNKKYIVIGNQDSTSYFGNHKDSPYHDIPVGTTVIRTDSRTMFEGTEYESIEVKPVGSKGLTAQHVGTNHLKEIV